MTNINNNSNNFKTYDAVNDDTTPDVITITDNDILLGRGDHTVHHVGNIRYRKLLNTYLNQFMNASRKERNYIADYVLNIICKQYNGRFLIRKEVNKNNNTPNNENINNSTYWIAITDEIELRNKIKKAFGNLYFSTSSTKSLQKEAGNDNKNVHRHPSVVIAKNNTRHQHQAEKNDKRVYRKKVSNYSTDNKKMFIVINNSDVTDNDVLLRRCSTSVRMLYSHHKGNIRYRQLLLHYLDMYLNVNKYEDKSNIINHIINVMKNQYNARFLRKINKARENITDYEYTTFNTNSSIVAVDINTSWILIDYESDELKRKIQQNLRDLKDSQQENTTNSTGKVQQQDQEARKEYYTSLQEKERNNINADLLGEQQELGLLDQTALPYSTNHDKRLLSKMDSSNEEISHNVLQKDVVNKNSVATLESLQQDQPPSYDNNLVSQSKFLDLQKMMLPYAHLRTGNHVANSLSEKDNNALLFDIDLDINATAQKDKDDNIIKNKSTLLASLHQSKHFDNSVLQQQQLEEMKNDKISFNRHVNITGLLSEIYNSSLLDLDTTAQEEDDKNDKKISAFASLKPDYDNYISQPNVKLEQTKSLQDTNIFSVSETDNALFDLYIQRCSITPYVVNTDIVDNDVLFGCGDHTVHHTGNIRYRRLLSQYLELFVEFVDNDDRDSIAELVMKTIIGRNGRFLRKADAYDINKLHIPPRSNSWIPITDITELQKNIKQAFRDFCSLERKKSSIVHQEEDKVRPEPAVILTESDKNVETLLTFDEESKQMGFIHQGFNLTGQPSTTATTDNLLLDIRRAAAATAIQHHEQEILIRAASNLLHRQQQERKELRELMQRLQQQQPNTITATNANTDYTTNERRFIDNSISPFVYSLLGQDLQRNNKRDAYELLMLNNITDENNKRQKVFYDIARQSFY